MARFTNIGMPRKTFVQSAAAEAEASTSAAQVEGPVIVEAPEPIVTEPVEGSKKKKTRRGKRKAGAVDEDADASSAAPVAEQEIDVDNIELYEGDGAKEESSTAGTRTPGQGWQRDPNVARMAAKTEERRLARQNERHAKTTCFACRGVGHASKECPNTLLAASNDAGWPKTAVAEGDQRGMKRKKGKMGGEVTGGKCYRCDSTEHALHQCNKPVDPENPTPFATCYVCLGVGHLSSLCPQNHKGVYVNGGSCKVCGSVAHRAKDCPDDKRGLGPGAADREDMSAYKAGLAIGMGAGGGADDDDFLVTSREVNRMTQNQAKNKGKRGPHEPAKNGHRGPAKMTALPPRDPPKHVAAASATAPATTSAEPVVAAPIIRRPAGGPKPKAKVVKF